jgi:hypothetical protein
MDFRKWPGIPLSFPENFAGVDVEGGERDLLRRCHAADEHASGCCDSTADTVTCGLGPADVFGGGEFERE